MFYDSYIYTYRFNYTEAPPNFYKVEKRRKQRNHLSKSICSIKKNGNTSNSVRHNQLSPPKHIENSDKHDARTGAQPIYSIISDSVKLRATQCCYLDQCEPSHCT
jgi:hypothetical protein